MDIVQIILLGLVQAVTEWLPLSSKTMSALVYTGLFNQPAENAVSVLLYLHLGTLFAAVVYFRKELASIFHNLFHVKRLGDLLNGKAGFLASSIFFTGLVGIPLLALEYLLIPALNASSLFSLMGAGLVVTGFMLTIQKKHNLREEDSSSWKDGILTGALQGLSVLPGISRAGCTTTALIWAGFNAKSAFRLSFLLSIPTILFAEIILWSASSEFRAIPAEQGIFLMASSFAFGYLTIDSLLRIAQKISVASLAFAFGIMMLLFGMIGTS